jgi:hypothetical protein
MTASAFSSSSSTTTTESTTLVVVRTAVFVASHPAETKCILFFCLVVSVVVVAWTTNHPVRSRSLGRLISDFVFRDGSLQNFLVWKNSTPGCGPRHTRPVIGPKQTTFSIESNKQQRQIRSCHLEKHRQQAKRLP